MILDPEKTSDKEQQLGDLALPGDLLLNDENWALIQNPTKGPPPISERSPHFLGCFSGSHSVAGEQRSTKKFKQPNGQMENIRH